MSSTFVISIRNGRVWGENGAIISPDGFLLSDISKQLGCLPCEHKIFRKFMLPKIIKSKYTIGVVATDGGNSYFHWMFDVLPRIKLLYESNIEFDKLLINNYSNKLFQNETLKILNINLNKIIPSSDNLFLEASNLIIPSLVNDTSGYIPKWACKFLRESFLRDNEQNNHKFHYIYISRQKAIGRKVINEEQVMKFLSHLDFKKIILEEMSFKKQVELFNSAKVVIAPHGAGLTNLIFCKQNTKIIEFFSPAYVNPCYYGLSNLVNLDYYYLLGEGKRYRDFVEPFGIRNNIFINIKKLKELLKIADIL
ncbi:MAG: glycosyltransferase family 61 protein [Candidatus Helarchaeota archaeon]